MRRFCLLLLMFVLPLQMSWAAVHYCDDERLLSATVVAAMTSGHDHDGDVAEQKAADQESGKIADACCEAAHGCHGLHHMVGHAGSGFAAGPSRQVPTQAGAAPPPIELSTRVERPQWSAA